MNKKKLIILISGIIVLAVLLLVGIFALSGDKSSKIADKLDMGEKYLAELNYEKALAVYKEVLTIDPKNVEAYLGIVETYVGMDDYENALKYAKEGYVQTQSTALEAKVKELEALVQGGDGSSSAENNDALEEDRVYRLTEVIRHNADGTSYVEETYVYDNNDYLIKILYDSGLVKDYQYDASGNVIEETYHNKDGLFTYGYKYAYSDDGTLMQTQWYHRNLEEWIVEFEQRFDDAGNLIYYVKRGDLSPTSNWYSLEEYFYDSYGNVIKENHRYRYSYELNSSSEACRYMEYIYNADGTLVETLYYDEDGVLKERFVHESFNDEGKILSEYRYICDDVNGEYIDEYKHEYEYDLNGRLVTSYQSTVDGEPITRIEYIHVDGTDYGKFYLYSTLFGGNELIGVHECRFDVSTGRVIDGASIWSGDVENIGNFYEFDKEGRLIKEERFTSDNQFVLLSAYEYDELGNLIKESKRDGSYITINEYNSKGELIKLRLEYDNKDVGYVEYTYEYDERGNLIKEIYIKNDEMLYWKEYIYKEIPNLK